MTMMSAEFLGMNLELPGSRKFLGLLPTAAHKSLPWKPLKSCPNMVRGQMKSLEFTPKHLVSYPKVSLGPDEKGDYRHPGSCVCMIFSLTGFGGSLTFVRSWGFDRRKSEFWGIDRMKGN